jgi:hypothetical protein
MFEVDEIAEFFHGKLGAVKALLYVFGISIRIREQLFELDLVVFLAFRGIQNFASAENAFSAILAGHQHSSLRWQGPALGSGLKGGEKGLIQE